MGFIGWILIGFIMGVIARVALPGKARGGWLVTLLVGVLGALLGGWLASVLFDVNANDSFFSLATWFWAFVGSLLVLAIAGVVTGTRRR